MRPSEPLNISKDKSPAKRRRKPKRNRPWLILAGSALGLVITLALGLAIYYLIMINKLQPGSAVFTGSPEMGIEQIALEYEEETHTDVSDDLEAAEAHEAEFEDFIANAVSDQDDAKERAKIVRKVGDDSLEEANGIVPEPSSDQAVSAPTGTPQNPSAQAPPQSLSGIRRDPNVKNFLVIGVDSRMNDFSGRSDAMMIVSINYNTGRINVASLFRAAYVQIPGYGWSMLNHAYAWGGISLLQQTIENNFRVGIDDYIVFNFGAFTNAINALGGIDIPLTQAEATYLGLAPGLNHMNSSQALSYARLRYIDWDFNRMGRQRQVISSVVSKLSVSGIGGISSAVGSVLSNTSTSLSHGQVTTMTANLPSLLNYGRAETSIPLPSSRQMFYKNGMEMWSFDFASNVNHLHAFLYGY